MDLSRFASVFSPPKPPVQKKPLPVEKPKDLEPKKVFLSWRAHSFKQKKSQTRKLNRTVIIIAIVVGLLLVSMGEFGLLLLIASVVFVSNVFSKVAPEDVVIEVSNHGVLYDGRLYLWEELHSFFFSQKEVDEVLIVDTKSVFPGRLFLHFDMKNKPKLKEYLEKRIHYIEKEPETFVDRAYSATLSKFNFEDKQ